MVRILTLANGWRDETIRGGDYHALRVLRNWSKENKISLIMPQLGYEAAKDMLHDGGYSLYLSSNEEEGEEGLAKLIILYLLRILRTSLITPKLDKPNPEIIISASHLLYDILPAVLLRRKLKCKLVVYVFHLFGSFRSYKQGIWSSISLLSEKLSLSLCKRVDLIFVDSTEIKDVLISKGFQANKIFVTGNGVEHEFIDSVKVDFKSFTGCFCGKLVKGKGVYDLLEVWNGVLRHFPKSRLVIIGQGPEYSNLRLIVKNKSLDKSIMLVGFVSEEQKVSLMKSSKIFISASYEEGWGIAVGEAMACGLSVICYDLSAYKIFGDAIIKVEVGNKAAMTKAVTDLLADENKQILLSAKAKEVAKLLDWDSIAEEELKMIYNL